MTLAERKTLVSFLEIYRLTSGGCSKNQWCKSETFMHFTSNQSLKPSVSPFVAVRTTLQSPIGSQQKTGRVHTKLFYKTAFLSKYHASAMMMMELAEKRFFYFSCSTCLRGHGWMCPSSQEQLYLLRSPLMSSAGILLLGASGSDWSLQSRG